MAVTITRRASLLKFDPSLVPPDGVQVVLPCAAPLKQLGKDAAGHAFHAFARRQSGLDQDESEAVDDAAADGDAETAGDSKQPAVEDQPPPGTEFKSKGKKKKKKSERPDLYALIGLVNERWTATENQIKLGYRKACLEHHPDKAGAATADDKTKAAIEDKFKLIQEAYDTLSDPQRRREYDSVDDFDDSLPFDCAAADFFKVFGPAFRRNSRWSVQQPVPEVGNEAAPWEAVNAFYDFWFTFRSWREFPHPDEEDTEQAESREERRWIERFNAKLREAAKKDEKRRFKEFVEVAYSKDPRVQQHREEERAQRDRRKQEKAQAARAKQEEEEARAAEEAAEKAAADASAAEQAAGAKKMREREKKAMQQQRKRIRAACAPLGFEVDDAMEVLCHALPLDGLQILADQLGQEDASHDDLRAIIQEQRSQVAGHKAAERAAHLAASPSAGKAAAKKKADSGRATRQKWDAEEVRMLEKALTKFPQGTAKRWDQVAGYVRTRTVEEVLDMVKHGLKGGKFGPSQNGVTIASKRQANTEIHSEATQRTEAFTDVEVNLGGSAGSEANGVPQENGNHPPEGGPGGAAANGSQADPASSSGASQPAGAAAASKPAPGEGWSEAQELALVQAMKKFGKETENRWERVAAEVPGKSHRQCLKRFKELRTSFKAAKPS